MRDGGLWACILDLLLEVNHVGSRFGKKWRGEGSGSNDTIIGSGRGERVRLVKVGAIERWG